VNASLWPFGISLTLFGLILGYVLRRHRQYAALRTRGRAIDAKVVIVNYATAAGGLRSRIATYEFSATDPTTGQPKVYRGSSADVDDPYEGEPVSVRYLPENPHISGPPTARALNRSLMMALVGFAVLSGVALVEFLGKNP
jgi:hypothetical protein